MKIILPSKYVTPLTRPLVSQWNGKFKTQAWGFVGEESMNHQCLVAGKKGSRLLEGSLKEITHQSSNMVSDLIFIQPIGGVKTSHFNELNLIHLKDTLNTLNPFTQSEFLSKLVTFRFYQSSRQQMWSWINSDPSFRVEQLGSKIMGFLYDHDSLNSLKTLLTFIKDHQPGSETKIQFRFNRGEDPIKNKWLPDSPLNWVAIENGVKYRLTTDRGLSIGIFLDQRNNRTWVKENSQGKRLLNLFSYTGGFSVNGALGGATQVTTVDIDQNYIDWSKENFELNGLDPAAHRFFKADSLFFIKMALKKNEKYDFIICDPPTFARNKKHLFKIEKDYVSLIQDLSRILNQNGKLLFCLNSEKFNESQWTKKIKDLNTGLSVKPFRQTLPDFNWKPGLSHKMKAFTLLSAQSE